MRILTLAALLSLFVSSVPLAQQDELPVDRNALFRTHFPHGSSSGLSSKPTGGGGGGTDPAVYTVGPVVTVGTTGPQAEEHIAVDPNTSSNLVAAISDFSLRGGSNTSKYAFSLDGGTTWTDKYVPLANGSPATGDGQVWPYNSDPVVAIDKRGNVYFANLYFHSESGNNANGVYVSVANLSAGSLFEFTQAQTYPVATNLVPSTVTSEDKEWIAVDNSASAYSGNVYVSWTRFVGNSDYIVLSRSTNQGQTWSAPVRISPLSQDGAVQGSQVAVGPGGEVYVAYQVYFVGGYFRHYLAKSTDGGLSFSAAKAITPQFKQVSFSSTYRKNSFPSLAVRASDGRIGLAFAVQATSAGGEVMFVYSADGGTTYSGGFRINNVGSGQQFMPALAVDGSGYFHASWFDTRNTGTSSKYDIYASRSTTGGSSWESNTRVTPTAIDAGSSSFIGDYAGIATGGGAVHPVWTSGGFNNGRLQTATLQ